MRILGAAYDGTAVELTLGVPPEAEAMLAGLVAAATSGARETRPVGERWVDSLEP